MHVCVYVCACVCGVAVHMCICLTICIYVFVYNVCVCIFMSLPMRVEEILVFVWKRSLCLCGRDPCVCVEEILVFVVWVLCVGRAKCYSLVLFFLGDNLCSQEQYSPEAVQ